MRKSNIELLRLLSMFLVLVLHANYLSIGAPDAESIPTLEFLVRHFIEVFTYIAVDLFILISGYFSIRPSVKSICNILFTCFFYSVGIRLIYSMWYWGQGEAASKPFLESFLFLSNSVWFVVDYLMLVVFAPILNAFIDNSSKKTSTIVVMLMLLFSTYFGLLRGSLVEYVSGFSFVTFIMIYLIGRVLYINKAWIESHVKEISVWGGYFVGLIGLYTIVIILSYRGHESYLTHLGRCIFFSYSNPLLILSAVCFFWLFVEREFYSERINKLAKSVFAILLLHSNPVSVIFYNRYFALVYDRFSFGLYLLIMILSCIMVFIISIVIDQIRMFLYDRYVKPRVLGIEGFVTNRLNEGI